ncbi:sporulation factor SpoIIGA [Lachnospiraceae bacterium CAG:215]|nr:sporulation factor SpoIIGA [Lachnospiraceae bacterium CAG:215]
MDTMSLFFVIASAAYAVLKGIQSLWENIQGEQKRICEVLLIQNEKKCRVRALLDTGNLLTDPVTKEPVCVADAQMITAFLGENIDKDSLKLHYLPFRSVGGNGVMPVIRIRQMQITEKQTIQVENPLLAISRGKLSEEEDYQMILNPDIVGGKKDGCKSSNARTV